MRPCPFPCVFRSLALASASFAMLLPALALAQGSAETSTPRLEPEPFVSGAMVLDYLSGLLSDAPIDNVLRECPERVGVVAHYPRASEWFCEHVPNPPGFPAGSSHLRFMESGLDIFALAVVPDTRQPERSAAMHRLFLEEIGQLCRCEGATNGVAYCLCPGFEVRLLLKDSRFALLAIDDIDRFLDYRESEQRGASTPPTLEGALP